MNLPSHNPVLRSLYILLLLLMGLFFIALIRIYWPQPTAPIAVNSKPTQPVPQHMPQSIPQQSIPQQAIPQQYKPQSSQTVMAATEKAPAELDPIAAPQLSFQLVEKNELVIAGISTRLQLNGDITKQLNQLWQAYYQRNIAHRIPAINQAENIYMVYHQYDSRQQSVEVLLGNASKQPLSDKSGLISLTIPAGKYLPAESVFDTWQNPLGLPISYQYDYEVYQLDKHYQVTSQKAFLSTYHP